MSRRTIIIIVAVALALVAAVVAGIYGCQRDKGDGGVVSIWPDADSERTTEKPVEPPRWPLTGLEAPSAEAITQRVVSVKIENSAESRPQTNLQLADAVYESVTEGGITRFNALYHSQAPESIGPVRSARLSDIYIVPQYHALFAFSGASPSVNAAVASAGIENLSEDAGVSRPYRRSSARRSPHNLYSGIPALREEAANRGMAATAEVPGLAFDQRVSADATPTITQVTIPFSNANTVTWTFDPATRAYLRVNNGRAFMDEGTGEQLRAKNVVVIWAQHNAASSDVTGSTTYDIVLAGSGRVSVFTNGQRYDGTWEAGRDTPPVFKAEDGTQIKLTPGNTWMQVVRTDVNITMQ